MPASISQMLQVLKRGLSGRRDARKCRQLTLITHLATTWSSPSRRCHRRCPKSWGPNTCCSSRWQQWWQRRRQEAEQEAAAASVAVAECNTLPWPWVARGPWTSSRTRSRTPQECRWCSDNRPNAVIASSLCGNTTTTPRHHHLLNPTSTTIPASWWVLQTPTTSWSSPPAAPASPTFCQLRRNKCNMFHCSLEFRSRMCFQLQRQRQSSGTQATCCRRSRPASAPTATIFMTMTWGTTWGMIDMTGSTRARRHSPLPGPSPPSPTATRQGGPVSRHQPHVPLCLARDPPPHLPLTLLQLHPPSHLHPDLSITLNATAPSSWPVWLPVAPKKPNRNERPRPVDASRNGWRDTNYL